MGKWSDYANYSSLISSLDTFLMLDVSDTSMAATGTQKEIAFADMLTNINSYGLGGPYVSSETTYGNQEISYTGGGSFSFPQGWLLLGVADTTVGRADFYGPSAGGPGAYLNLYLSGAHDTSFDRFTFQADEDDLLIGPNSDPDAFKFVGSLTAVTGEFTVGLITTDIRPEADGTRDCGIQNSYQWANVWADLVNGSDISLANNWRILESDKYNGYPKGVAIGNEGFKNGVVTEKMADNLMPLFAITEDFIEYKGIRIDADKLKKIFE
jgi:hypothetical protein